MPAERDTDVPAVPRDTVPYDLVADPEERVTVPVERDALPLDLDTVPLDLDTVPLVLETDPDVLDTEDCTPLLTVLLLTAVSPDVLLRDTLEVLLRETADPVLAVDDRLTALLWIDEVLGPYEAVEFLEP